MKKLNINFRDVKQIAIVVTLLIWAAGTICLAGYYFTPHRVVERKLDTVNLLFDQTTIASCELGRYASENGIDGYEGNLIDCPERSTEEVVEWGKDILGSFSSK